MSATQATREARWQALAQTKGVLARALWPVSVVYGTLMALRRWLYATGRLTTHRLPVPVIVVGNVVVGGAGKTPTVIALVKHLQSRGWRPGVVSRGHGGTHTRPIQVKADTPLTISGDEPALIHRNTGAPVFVAKRRVDAARALLETCPNTDVLICDDGLQHLALARDVSIVVFDDRGTGNGWLLPAGLLREPWPPHGELGKPDFVLHQHRDDRQPTAVPLPPGTAAFNATRHLSNEVIGAQGERLTMQALQGTSLSAVAGIARPDVFFDMLRARGLTLLNEVALPDHAELADYAALLSAGPATLICTEKDAVKLFQQAIPAGSAVWSAPLEVDIDPAFFNAIEKRASAWKAED
ncbi:tetraacyldisaccharide 4'-kinase [Hydrogenophaga sp.]|uniref:tetraacyldisaccharide 4'-kinase n=1 Tax=Hydrogenophaga sp. TaxID=1904254 RepID=UPI002725069F|nr:tetraacyldisaccharide 4'-kinase [Hydrogenophaga sp.]MDO8906687.1 tetraacyldisaccharide 4'-kinase [Hydrogenophaga sp.]